MAKSSSRKKRRIHFEPDGIDVVVEEGTNLLEAAIEAGVRLTASCGGAGVCGTCKVMVERGEVESTRTEKVSDEEYERGLRQACQSRVITDLMVRVPVESRLETEVLAREERVIKTGAGRLEAVATGWKFNPPLSKYFVELPPPTLQDNVSDLSRVLRGLKQRYKLRNLTVDFDVVKKLPQVLRKSGWKVTVSTLLTAADPQDPEKRRPRVMNIERGDTRKKHYSLAVDIGTTTICMQLLDLRRGKVMAEGMAYNGQISYGADVISRIAYCQKPGGLKKMQQVVVATTNGLIKQLLSQKRIGVQHIGHIIVAGNTTMMQILLGLDPTYIRLSPYVPVATYIPPVKAKSLGIKLGEHVYLFPFPQVSSYVGGDIISGIVASGVHQRKRLTFYMDIGTNGEIVIGNSDWMVTAACSAGPAFEGGGVKHGMVAINGAIEQFSLDPSSREPVIGTIAGARPKGICGSGLINITAGMLEAGIIGQNGKFNTDADKKRIRLGRDGYEYILARAAETETGQDIVITEADIDNLIRAKAAMYAGCQTLIKSVGMTCQDIEEVIMAGAFGSHIDIEKSIAVGLLPDLPRDRIVFIGNGSLMGARMTSFSTDMLDDARKVARLMTNFELSEDVNFMNNYMAALFLPHTDIHEFPSVAEKLRKLAKVKSKRGVTA